MIKYLAGKTNKKKRGFTLVELAIVLVIIGLIITVVLTGQDLIRSAEMRSIVGQYQAYMTGVLAFQNKYNNRVPGDVDGRTYGLRGGSAGTAGLGDQNGIITASGVTTTTAMSGETMDFWAHLTSSGKELIPGSFLGHAATPVATTFADSYIPTFRFNKLYGWGVYGSSGTSKNYFIAGVSATVAVAASGTPATSTASITSVNVFIPLDANNVDAKIDDGVPTAGIVQAAGAASGTFYTVPSSAATASTSACVDTSASPNAYQYTASARQCALRFEMTNY